MPAGARRLQKYYAEYPKCKVFLIKIMFFGEKKLLILLINSVLVLKKELTMLVLSRKKDEMIILKGPNMEDIKITVVRIDNRNKVRIGIEAEKEITVLRSEIEDRPFNN